ncbi:MAG TPA: cell division protein ZapA [Casimicrobiaceae bacterium]|jgi:cell division protein ZapA
MSVKGDSAATPLMIDVTIFGRQYKVACNEDERAELAEAVAHLDKKMREIRDRGKVAGVDRIAVMAALNIMHDLLRERQADRDAAQSLPGNAIDESAARRRIQAMQVAIDQTLAGQEKLF